MTIATVHTTQGYGRNGITAGRMSGIAGLIIWATRQPRAERA